jgi:hypothetical protein
MLGHIIVSIKNNIIEQMLKGERERERDTETERVAKSIGTMNVNVIINFDKL